MRFLLFFDWFSTVFCLSKTGFSALTHSIFAALPKCNAKLNLCSVFFHTNRNLMQKQCLFRHKAFSRGKMASSDIYGAKLEIGYLQIVKFLINGLFSLCVLHIRSSMLTFCLNTTNNWCTEVQCNPAAYGKPLAFQSKLDVFQKTWIKIEIAQFFNWNQFIWWMFTCLHVTIIIWNENHS